MSEYFRKPIVKTLMLKGQDAVSISDIEKKTSSGLTDTYEITLTDGTKRTFNVSNGKGIRSIAKTSTSGLIDTYTTTYNDGTTSTFTVKNGEKGDTGSIDNLKIGCVNLLSNTKYLDGDWINKDKWNISEEKYNGFTVLTNKGPWYGFQKNIEGKKGEKYTFSLYLKRLKQDGVITFFATTDGGATIDNGDKDINVTDEWARYYFTFTLTSDGLFSPRVECNARVEGVFAMCGLKLEREETPTDWTPSLEDIENEIASAKDILNKTYPIGSIYMSVNDTNPSTLFGGTWERLQGRFLIGAGAVTDSNSNTRFGSIGAEEPDFKNGETGGQYFHKLNVDEMPEHSHTGNYYNGQNMSPNNGGVNPDGGYHYDWSNGGSNSQNEMIFVASTGGGQEHNNMPPYLAVFMWKRTA